MNSKSRLEKIAFDLPDRFENLLSPEVSGFIEQSRAYLTRYWDRWTEHAIEQYVACDFAYVAAALAQVQDRCLTDGKSFLEWGCGLGVVTGIAWLNGWDATGIEAEAFLVAQANEFLSSLHIEAEIWQGNFLPEGADDWADTNADHASLFHHVPPAYNAMGRELDDFAVVFAYPWPGEHFYLQEVFRRAGRAGGLLIIFKGPFEIELYRKSQ